MSLRPAPAAPPLAPPGGALTARIWALADTFLPPGLPATARVERLRARLLIVFCWLFVAVAGIAVLPRAADPASTAAELLTFAVYVLLAAAGPFILRATGQVRGVAMGVAIVGLSSAVAGAVAMEGVFSTSIVWVGTLPILLSFLIGPSSTLPAVLVASVVFLGVATLHVFHLAAPASANALIHRVVNLIALTAFSAILARLHEWAAAEAQAGEADAQALFEQAAVQAGVATIVLEGGRVLTANAAADALLSRDGRPLVGTTWAAIAPAGAEAAAAPGAHRVELDVASPAGPRRIEMRSSAIPGRSTPLVLILLIDQTDRWAQERERRLLHARLQETERLDSLGRIAGGVAHDFNNLLVGIMCNAELLAQSPQLSPDDRLSLSDIRTASERAASLVAQLLAYAGRGRAALRPLDAVAATREAVQLAEAARRSPRAIALSATDAAGACTVLADAALFAQVCTNLLTNAIDAGGPNAAPGSVRVQVDSVDANAALLAQSLVPGQPPAPGRYVRVTITDGGPGIPPELRGRLFEPFFTTKSSGSGLGLPAVQGILKRLGGALLLDSPPGAGATFTALFPPSAGVPLEDGPSAERPAAQSSRRLRAMVIDDDPLVRAQIARVLTRAAIAVTEADAGAPALAALDHDPSPVDLVLIDFLLPGMDGVELARHLRRRHPALPLILCSGTVADADVPDGLFAAVVPKPFAPAALVDAVLRATPGVG